MHKEKDMYAIYGLIDNLRLWPEVKNVCNLSAFNKKSLCEYLVNEQGFTYDTFKMFLIESNFLE